MYVDNTLDLVDKNYILKNNSIMNSLTHQMT